LPQYFILSEDIKDNQCILSGDDFHHIIHVRRMQEGDSLSLRDDKGTFYTGKIANIQRDSLIVKFQNQKKISPQQIRLTLFVAFLKGKKFDFVVQKATEVGVSKIVPVYTERTVANIEKNSESKINRWAKIALEASKQCLRQNIPEINFPCSFKDALLLTDEKIKLIASLNENLNFKSFLDDNFSKEVALFIGPEGGFSKQEIELAEKNGWTALQLYGNQLRAETAAIVLPAIILYEWSRE